ncbi:MAG: HAD-IIIC family phosphatase [Lachnospiraceae bacterium]|nr:HAD-IIIC family phosphatase [Lachnospiraceae bacterium]
MKELEYPFDGDLILASKKSLKRQLLAERQDFLSKKIAILGGGTTAAIRQTLELFLLQYGISPSFYESEYNQYYQDACFDNPRLMEFGPDLIYVCTSNRNVIHYPEMSDSAEQIGEKLRGEYDRFEKIWSCLRETYHCPVIQNNFEMPAYRLLGNKDASDPHGRVHFLSRLNLLFAEYADSHDNFFLCDINYISADYGLREWSDPFYWYMYKYALNVSAIPLLSFNVANIIKSLYGKNQKGLVLDLDNTLWGGVVGDDGPEHIVIGPEEAEGQAYTEFQEYVRDLSKLGVLLTVDSKNDEENALAGLRHPDSVLHPEDFVCVKANWDPKDRNFTQIAQSLNLLPESLVFVDDNPAERHIIKSAYPGVATPAMEEAHHYIQSIDRAGYFEVTVLSEDDRRRSEMYKENAQREQLKSSFSDYREYLLSLEMKAVIRPFEPVYLDRIAQLTNKSNQFNLTTKRYTPADIARVAEDPVYLTFYGKLEDRFGDNGVVSILIGRKESGICHMDLWLMSCRVLKRDMEYAMMDALVERCRQESLTEIRGYYYPTAKNKMVRDFYGDMGFTLLSEDEEGNRTWQFLIDDAYQKKNTVIAIV